MNIFFYKNSIKAFSFIHFFIMALIAQYEI